MIVRVKSNCVKEWTELVKEEFIKTLQFIPYYPKTVKLVKQDHLTPFLNAVLVPSEQSAHVLVSKKEKR